MTDEEIRESEASKRGREAHAERVAEQMRANLKKRKARQRALARPDETPTTEDR